MQTATVLLKRATASSIIASMEGSDGKPLPVNIINGTSRASMLQMVRMKANTMASKALGVVSCRGDGMVVELIVGSDTSSR